MWINDRDGFMILSNFSYLLLGLGYAYKRLWYDAFLRIMVFVFSNNYHICYRRVHDAERATLDDLCLFSMNNIFFTLLIDEVFANMAALSGLTKLLPADLATPRVVRYLYTIIGGFLVWFTTLWNGAFFTYDFFADNNGLILAAMGSFFALLFVVHFWFYGWARTKAFYTIAFRVYLIPVSLGVLCLGIFVWSCVNRIFGVSYEWSHPFWHFITQLADLLVLIAIRSYHDRPIF